MSCPCNERLRLTQKTGHDWYTAIRMGEPGTHLCTPCSSKSVDHNRVAQAETLVSLWHGC